MKTNSLLWKITIFNREIDYKCANFQLIIALFFYQKVAHLHKVMHAVLIWDPAPGKYRNPRFIWQWPVFPVGGPKAVGVMEPPVTWVTSQSWDRTDGR